MKLLNLHSILLITFLCSVFYSAAQDEIPLSVQHKIYAKGGSIVVGNSMLSKHKTKPFDRSNISNDEVNMVYVDIDADPETFSSSSANIELPKASTRILYAALYWGGLYPSEKSTMQKGNIKISFKPKGARATSVDSIKIKWGNKAYVDIKGDIIYDAKGMGKFKEDSPYVCRAEITDYLNSSDLNFGNFTVANVRGVKGKIAGGSAAGWHLYIVYENANFSPKYFTTFDGFRQVAKEPVEITFSDFQTKSTGDIESTLVMAALEGDIKIKSDECAIYSATSNKYVTLQTATRDRSNFFQSSITHFSEAFLDRNPASQNTLGFDLLKMKLADGIITYNAEEAKIRFKSKADRFYLYFTAFETEIEETLINEMNSIVQADIEPVNVTDFINKADTKALTVVPQKTVLTSKNDTIATTQITEEEKAVEITKVSPTVIKEVKTIPKVVQTQAPIKSNRKHPITKLNIDGMTSGYFLITNVFSKKKLAENWTQNLLDKGYNPQQFINPRNNWIYVYILRTNNLDDVRAKRLELKRLDYFEKIWIAGINR